MTAKKKKKKLTPDELQTREKERDAIYARLMAEGDMNAIFPPWAAGRFLTLSESTLATWRRLGGGRGPKYTRLSAVKVGYAKRALIEYSQSREYESTSADPNAPTRANREAGA